PQVSLEQAGAVRLDARLRSSPLESAIPTIPYAAIAAFLSRPTVMTADQIRDAPYVFAFRDMHEIAGSGNEVYVRNLAAAENARFAVVHVADPLRDPDDGDLVGYVGIYTATALVQRAGDPAKALLIDPARAVVRDLYRGGKKIGSGVGTSFAPKVKLPDERSGTLLVFKVFDRVSFGLIVGASDTIHVADVVRSP